MTAAAAQFRAFIERIERLEEERKTIADDIAEVYAELKGSGFDKDAAKTVIKIRRVGIEAYQEKSTMVDLYLSALGMIGEPEAPARAPARTREIIEEFPPHDPETGELAEQSEAVAATETAVDDLREPAAVVPGQIVREGDAPRETDRLGGDASRPDTEFTHSSAAPTPSADEQTGASQTPAAPVALSNPQPNSSREADKAGGAPPPASPAVPDFVPAFLAADARPKPKLRPNCLRPETCAGHGVKHCHSCEKAAAAQSEAA